MLLSMPGWAASTFVCGGGILNSVCMEWAVRKMLTACVLPGCALCRCCPQVDAQGSVVLSGRFFYCCILLAIFSCVQPLRFDSFMGCLVPCSLSRHWYMSPFLCHKHSSLHGCEKEPQFKHTDSTSLPPVPCPFRCLDSLDLIIA